MNDTYLNDASVVRDIIKTNNNTSFQYLYNKYYPKLYAYCYKIIKNNMDAEDIAQESFIKAMEKLNNLKNAEYFSGWLFSIARNACRDYQTKGNNLTDLTEISRSGYESEDNSEADDEKEALLNAMEEIIKNLPPDMKQIIHAKYYENKSLEEIAAETGLGLSAVKMRLSRLRKKIQVAFIQERTLGARSC